MKFNLPWWESESSYTFDALFNAPGYHWEPTRETFGWARWEQQWADAIGLGINGGSK